MPTIHAFTTLAGELFTVPGGYTLLLTDDEMDTLLHAIGGDLPVGVRCHRMTGTGAGHAVDLDDPRVPALRRLFQSAGGRTFTSRHPRSLATLYWAGTLAEYAAALVTEAGEREAATRAADAERADRNLLAAYTLGQTLGPDADAPRFATDAEADAFRAGVADLRGSVVA